MATFGEGAIKNVAILVAMEEEAAPMIEKMGLTRSDAPLGPASAPMIVHTGTYNDATITVVQPGKDAATGVNNVGTVPAALATFLACSTLKPDLLLNAGTCGGFKRQGGAVGDVYISTAFKNHDRRIPIPGYTEYGIGAIDATPAPALVEALGFKTGVVSSGNSLDCTPADDELLVAGDASVKDMEGAAVAWAAAQTGTPLVAIKVVTDIVDGEHATQDEFLENLGTAAASLQAAVPAVLGFVVGKPIAEL